MTCTDIALLIAAMAQLITALATAIALIRGSS